MFLDVGILVNWTKSFNCDGVIGEDVVRMFNESIAKMNNLKVNVVAILNDTTGTLVKGSYDDPNCCIGLILGTGCNGAYLEKAERVHNWDKKENVNQVIIDSEFGAFGDNGCIDFIKTEFDHMIDDQSLLPKSFTYEKYFAGKYIGELARLILLKLHQQDLLFYGKTVKLSEKGIFTSSDLSEIENDAFNATKVFDSLSLNGSYAKTYGIFSKLGISEENDINKSDLRIVQYVCKVLSERCGLLVGVPLAVFLDRIDKEGECAIAVTGSLYKYHPRLKMVLEKYIAMALKKSSIRFYTFLSDDGSGKGAGLVAAIAERVRQ